VQDAALNLISTPPTPDYDNILAVLAGGELRYRIA